MKNNFKIFFENYKNVCLSRGQFGEVDSVWDYNISDGEYGRGIYFFFCGDKRLEEYYTKNGETLSNAYIDRSEILDLTKYNTKQYWDIQEIIHKSNKSAFKFKHIGDGIPTGYQVLVTNPEALNISNV